ncbi:MAG: glutamate--cysteine ligase [Alphaproteobacteria bacterium]
MAGPAAEASPLETREDLLEALEGGCKPVAQWRVGTEHEKFGFYVKDLSPVPYEGPRGVRQLLYAMAGLLGWKPIMDAGEIIGLTDPVGLGAITLEPGGQLELSGAPLETIHQTCREVNAHLAQVNECATPLGIGFLGAGFSPKWSLDDTPRMPKSRYRIMSGYMPKVGAHGLDMMYRSATIQANLDFSDEADMVKKVRVGLALQPIVTALFAFSPFSDGQPNGFQSIRSHVWLHTDARRTGMLPFAFEDGFGFERYADWALDVPMYFVKRGDRYHDVTGASFRDFLDGRLEALPGERPTMEDWETHLTTLFPEVRIKRFIEMRGADGGPDRRICALPALWVGLLYDAQVLDQALELVRDWSSEERDLLRNEVPRTALETAFRNRTVRDVAEDMLALAREGLRRRARLNNNGLDETMFLSQLEETVAIGRAPAMSLLERYEGPWERDVTRFFREYAY